MMIPALSIADSFPRFFVSELYYQAFRSNDITSIGTISGSTKGWCPSERAVAFVVRVASSCRASTFDLPVL